MPTRIINRELSTWEQWIDCSGKHPECSYYVSVPDGYAIFHPSWYMVQVGWKDGWHWHNALNIDAECYGPFETAEKAMEDFENNHECEALYSQVSTG